MRFTKDPRPGFCHASVSDRTGFHSYQCSKRMIVTVDGHDYCGQHDPFKAAARQAKAKMKYDEEFAKRRVEIHGSTFLQALQVIASGTVEDPVAYAHDVLLAFAQKR